jgi:DME family drug/metabolite transporter
MESNKKGVILCLISAFCYALGPIICKLLFITGLPWRVVVSCRGMIPAILVLLYAVFFAKNVFHIKKEHFKWFILNGLSFGFISVCNYCSLYYINASVATVLLYTLPVFTVLLSRFMLKEKFTVPKVIAMILVFCGTVCIINLAHMDAIAAHPELKIMGIPSVVFGILIGIMSGLLSALYTIFTRKLNQYYDGWTVNSWCYFLGFPVFLVVGGGPIIAFDWHPLLVLFVVIMALIGLTAYSLYAVCMHYIDAGKASLVVTLDPVMSVTMSVLILGETLSPIQFVGCLLVAGGILFMERGQALIYHLKTLKEKTA